MARLPRASLLFVAVWLAACQAPTSAEKTGISPAAPAAPAAATAPAATDAPAATATAAQFTDRVWRVQTSSSLEPGTTYAFLGDGTLVIASPHGTPMYGQWRYENGALTMIEEGQSYPTDILALSDTELRLRSHNPGEPVDIALVAAPDAALPQARR